MYCKSSISWTSALSSEQTVSSCNLKTHTVTEPLVGRCQTGMNTFHDDSIWRAGQYSMISSHKPSPQISFSGFRNENTDLAWLRVNIIVLLHSHTENGSRNTRDESYRIPTAPGAALFMPKICLNPSLIYHTVAITLSPFQLHFKLMGLWHR